VLHWIAPFLNKEKQDQLGVLFSSSKGFALSYKPYDWHLNSAKKTAKNKL